MKTDFRFRLFWNQIVKFIPIALIAVVSISCNTEIVDPDPQDPPDNSIGPEKFLFTYWEGDYYNTQELSSAPGNSIFTGSDMGHWQCMVGVQAGPFQYLVGHNTSNNEYSIRLIENSGVVKDFTDRGRWGNSYECFVGFHVGDRGFIFGQDSEDDHYWFVQGINQNGTLGGETDSGEWHNTYNCVPLYVGTETYLFFQEGGGNTSYYGGYWFISHVSSDGVLRDVDSGDHDEYWDALASCIVNGTTFLIGWENVWFRGRHGNPEYIFEGDLSVMRINPNGTMGDRTDYFESRELFAGHMVGYESGGKGYVLFQKQNSAESFIREITADGKFGNTTYTGYQAKDFMQLVPLNRYSPGNFRYQIGWDLSKSSGSPGRWSPMYSEPWTSQAGFGGGAALGKINNNKNDDALFVGFQNWGNTKRLYYQIAWDLDNTGKPSGWSSTMYGPYCGNNQAGAGADIADIDRNGIPDLVFMYVDNPEGANSFVYRIGWNLDSNGNPASWSDGTRLTGLGDDNAGGGLAVGDLDGNGQSEMVLIAVDNPAGANKVWYTVVQLDQAGKTKSMTSMLQTPFDLGDFSAGGGASLADVDGNGKPDLVLVNIDSPQGGNPFWGQIGYDIDINGNVSRWTTFEAPSLGSISSGGGAAIGDIDKNGILDLLLMTLDNPYGKD